MRILVLLPARRIPAWQHLALQKIVAPHGVHVIAACPPDMPGTRAPSPDGIGGRILRLIERRESARGERNPDACERIDVTALAAAHGIELCDAEGPEFPPDLILSFIPHARAADVAQPAALGTLQLDLGALLAHDDLGISACLEAFLRREPMVEAKVRCIDTEKAESRVVYATTSTVHPLSFTRTRNEYLWKLASLYPRLVRRVVSGGPEGLSAVLGQPAVSGEQRSPRSSGRMVGDLGRHVVSRARDKWARRRYTERWVLMYRTDGRLHGIGGYTPLLPPPDKFWADPHLVSAGDRHYLFFEEACRATGRGHISVTEISARGEIGTPVVALQRPYHLSYPFVFRWLGEYYMIPETAGNRSIEAYRCVRFPDRWEYHRTIMDDLFAVDATLLEHAGRWWLFANVRENEGASEWDELCLFHAEEPFADAWIPHPLNPVVSDVRSARPAGAILRRDGELYRPSQDCSHRYGYGLNLARIVELDTENYREEIVDRLRPAPGGRVRAVHSLATDSRLVVIDAMYREERGNHAGRGGPPVREGQPE